MSKIERSFLSLHGHFSQPPRGNPFTIDIGVEPEAQPFQNWNERITATSYRPNAEKGNFKFISFSFSEGLLRWLENNAPETFAAIIDADKEVAQGRPAGAAIATAYNHIILPLARKRDKRTQIIWGIAAFEYRFGRKPLGFWLPEMAVDTETLELLADSGIQYTLLAGKQVHNLPFNGGAGPYRVELPHGKSIGVFVRQDELSAQISFNIHNLGGAGRWSHQVLGPARKNAGPLMLLATAGETFGHHFAGEEEFLYWLVNYEAASAGYQLVTLDNYLGDHPPQHTVQIEELSSWGDHPTGLTHWATGYVDQDTLWKGALRRALDNVASEVDHVYGEMLWPLNIDPWNLRERFIAVIMNQQTPEAFLAEQTPALAIPEREKLLKLLRAERLTQRMYNSYTFTENRLESRSARHAIACAAAALSLAQEATGHNLSERFPRDMAVVRSASANGEDILRSVVQEFSLNLQLE